MGVRTELGARILVAALLTGVAAWVLFAFFYLPADAEDAPPRPGPDGPAAADVSALIEEARRITKEATG
jgi:hypothetical protein